LVVSEGAWRGMPLVVTVLFVELEATPDGTQAESGIRCFQVGQLLEPRSRKAGVLDVHFWPGPRLAFDGGMKPVERFQSDRLSQIQWFLDPFVMLLSRPRRQEARPEGIQDALQSGNRGDPRAARGAVLAS
jgi:hypothetical protein